MIAKQVHSDATGPVRTCVGCRKRDAQGALVRLVAADGQVAVDAERRRAGRGAWVHPDPRCVRRVGIAVLERSLRRKLAADATAGLSDRVAGHSRRDRYPSELPGNG